MTDDSYPRDIPGLTSLRFFAAVWVVIHHYVAWLVPEGGAEVHVPVINMGSLAVDFFFVLSGFILTHAHREQLKTRSLPYIDFLVRRIARIYPMHLLTLLFYLAMVVALAAAHVPLPNPERYSALQFLLNVFLVHAWQFHDAGAWNYPSWSVSAEWAAYLVFPIFAVPVMALSTRVSSMAMVLASLALLLMLFWLVPQALGKSFFELHSNFGYVRIFPEFLLGIALYRLGAGRPMPLLGHPAVIGLTVLATIAMAWQRWELPVVLALAFLILAVAESARSGRTGLLTSRSAIYGGEISYDLYMVHLPVATVMLKGSAMLLHTQSAPLWMLPLATLVALAAAAFCHRYLETPARMAILRTWRNRRLRQAATVV